MVPQKNSYCWVFVIGLVRHKQGLFPGFLGLGEFNTYPRRQVEWCILILKWSDRIRDGEKETNILWGPYSWPGTGTSYVHKYDLVSHSVGFTTPFFICHSEGKYLTQRHIPIPFQSPFSFPCSDIEKLKTLKKKMEVKPTNFALSCFFLFFLFVRGGAASTGIKIEAK